MVPHLLLQGLKVNIGLSKCTYIIVRPKASWSGLSTNSTCFDFCTTNRTDGVWHFVCRTRHHKRINLLKCSGFRQ